MTLNTVDDVLDVEVNNDALAKLQAREQEERALTLDAEGYTDGLTQLQALEEQEAEKRKAREQRSLALAETPAPKAVRMAAQPTSGLWTLASLRARKVATADLYGDGGFLFTFDPVVITSDWAQTIFLKAADYFTRRDEARLAAEEAAGRGEAVMPEAPDDEGDVTFASLYREYGDVLYETLRPGKWAFAEEVDDEDGNPVYEADGVTRKLKPWPISRVNIGKLSWEEIQDFFTACFRSMRGEVSGQP